MNCSFEKREKNHSTKSEIILTVRMVSNTLLLISNSEINGGVLLQVAEVYLHFGAHGDWAGAHSPPWGIRYPLGLGLSHLSW